jgi:hypothetical protein
MGKKVRLWTRWVMRDLSGPEADILEYTRLDPNRTSRATCASFAILRDLSAKGSGSVDLK